MREKKDEDGFSTVVAGKARKQAMHNTPQVTAEPALSSYPLYTTTHTNTLHTPDTLHPTPRKQAMHNTPQVTAYSSSLLLSSLELSDTTIYEPPR